jgi:sorting nexin-29
VELLKANEAIRKEIHKLIVKIWRTEQIPTDWKCSIICPVYKNKGDKLSCQNYSGISLLCTCYKVFTTVLKNKLETYAEQLIGAYQAGFRKRKSTADQLFTVRLILEKFWEYKIDVHQIFVDFKQAHDEINREKLYKIMLYFGIPEKLIRLTKVTVEDSAFYVKIQTELTEPTTKRNGLKQGDGLAPLLFNIVLEYVIRKSNINTDGTLIYKSIQVVAYADDVNIMARTQQDLKSTYILIEQNAKKVGLQINTTKTKVLTQTRANNPTVQNITIGVQKIDAVKHFTYLGTVITSILKSKHIH